MKAILSIKPKYVRLIEQGIKKVELRRVIPKKRVSEIIVYESNPTKKVIGTFKIGDIHSDHPDKIWEKFGDVSGVTKEEFYNYFKNVKVGYAIGIENFSNFKTGVPLSEFGLTKAPQSFQYHNRILSTALEDFF